MKPGPEQMLLNVSSPCLQLLPLSMPPPGPRGNALDEASCMGQLFQAPVCKCDPLCLLEETNGKQQESQRQTAAWEACSVRVRACRTSVAPHTDQTRQCFKMASVFQAEK